MTMLAREMIGRSARPMPNSLNARCTRIHTFLELGARRLQHLVGLADAGRRAEEDLEAPGAAFLLAPDVRKEGFGRRSLPSIPSSFQRVA
jgi:hypothetical protein